MSRIAIAASLALHTALVSLAGWRWSPVAWQVGSGKTEDGAAAAFFAEADSLFTETPPPAVPAPVGPQFTEPEFMAPAPVEVVLSASPQPSSFVPVPARFSIAIAAAPTISLPKLKVSSSKSRKTNRRAPAGPGGYPGANGGSGGGNGGAGSGNAGYLPPQFRVRYKPPYPEEARAQRLEGTVFLLVSIDASGRVTDVNVQASCGHAVLDLAALEAVRAWRFEPAMQDGAALAARVEVPVRFCFEERHQKP